MKKKCIVCSKKYLQNEIISSHGIRQEIKKLILKEYPIRENSFFICKNDYEKYRIRYITELIIKERGQLKKLESEVLKNISGSEIISSNINVQGNHIPQSG
ncbi:MAG: hypothetical protein JW881_12995 [Spirochaetales bacterium]|nr:hypothetical protein [Spirochaetales bacterium]